MRYPVTALRSADLIGGNILQFNVISVQHVIEKADE